MITLNSDAKVYVHAEPVDMRKAIDGLAAIVVSDLEQNPQGGDLFLFRNKARNKVKALLWDRNGFILHYKRLEKGRFKFPKSFSEEYLAISEEQLSWLLAGLDFVLMEQHSELNYSNYF